MDSFEEYLEYLFITGQLDNDNQKEADNSKEDDEQEEDYPRGRRR